MTTLMGWLRGDSAPVLGDLTVRSSLRDGRQLTASARVLAAGDRAEANRLRKLRSTQPWQADAWEYRDSIGEIRYAMGFLAHALSRMRIFGATSTDPGDDPIPLDESPDGLPAGMAAAAGDAVARIAGGAGGALGELLGDLGENLEIPGEAYLLGRTTLAGEEWSIRSTDELKVHEGRYALSPEPGAKGSDLEPLPDDAYIARLWQPHPRYSRLADSPMRALVLGGVCEELLLTSRMIRRASKSRLAGNGILVVDQSIEFPSAPGADEDEQSEPFTAELMRAMIAPIADESAPSAMVPLVVRADLSENRKALEHIKLFDSVDDKLLERQDKALRRIAMGLDVPPEVILGMADVNHWTAWQVDDSTFRHHIEPLVIRGLAMLTVGYLRPMLIAAGFPQEQAALVQFWYDPVELVTNPNRVTDAKAGHEALVLSDATLVTALGYDPDEDMPDDDERLRRMAEARGSIDPPLTEAMLKAALADIMLTVERARTQADPGAPVQPALPAPGEGEGKVTVPPVAETGPTPIPQQPAASPPPAVAAAGSPQPVDDPVHGPVLAAHVRASRRLADIDRQLLDRLAAAADAALRRALERAGNRVRTQANRDPQARAAVAACSPRDAYAVLLAAGTDLQVDPAELLDGAWSDLRDQWNAWTVAAREQAVSVAMDLAGVHVDEPAVQDRLTYLTRGYQAADEQAWAFLVAGLDRVATRALTAPGETAPAVAEEPEWMPVSPGGVLLSLVRGALGLLGGLPAGSSLTPDGTPVDGGSRLGGPATGALVDGFLREAGQQVIGYEWVYGISEDHFEPHRALDGVTFREFGDPVLANPAGPTAWPHPTLAPGDHRGCHCDAMPVYADGLSGADAALAVGDATYDDSYLRVLRAIADDDIAAGRLDTSPIRELMEAERVASSRPSRSKKSTPADGITDAVQLAGGRVPAANRTAPWEQAQAPEVPTWTATPESDLIARLDTLDMDELDELAGLHPEVFTDPALSERFQSRMDHLEQADRDARAGGQPPEVQSWYAAQLARDEEARAVRADALPPPRPKVSTGDAWHAAKREEYQTWLEGQYADAEAATNGDLLTPAGSARGLTVQDLYSMRAASAVRYASEDLIRYWREHPRRTWTEWRDGPNPAFAALLDQADDLRSGRGKASPKRGRALSAADKLAQDQARIARARKAAEKLQGGSDG